ncbi:MAG: glycosyltransferase family 9 protein [Candidatus Omnitrophota bacterium]|nr:glycosyltransferase family 9 protein [Candidatus Omnitrophota bacterium]
MNIRAMRIIDYWLGRPLCFLFSVANFIARIIGLGRRKQKAGQEKILFIKLSEMGAIVLAYPLMNKMKEERQSEEMFFLTFSKNRDIFKILGGIIPDKNIFVIREDCIFLFIMDTFRVISKIRKEKIDIVFDLELFSRFTSILAYLSNARKSIGYFKFTFEGLYRGSLLTHRFQYNPFLHISKSYLALLQGIEKEKKLSPELEKRIEDSEVSLPGFISETKIKDAMKQRLNECGIGQGKRIILINPGEGALPLREWPIENFIALSRRILENSADCIVIIGTKDASKKSKLLSGALNNKRCVDFTGKTSLDELMELFNIASILITNDCGLAHLAALTPIKKLVFFGPETPRVFGPLGDNNTIFYSHLPCSPCLSAFNNRDSQCRDNKCLKAIDPNYVYQLIKDL